MSERNPHEADRRLNNVIRNGTIRQHKSAEGKLLARVEIHGRLTDWLPVKGMCNSFVKIYFPIRIGEQVQVHAEFGEADSGVIERSIFCDDCPEPEGADNDTAIMLFHDGGEIRYNTKTGKMELNAIMEAKIIAPHIELVCETIHSTGSMDIDGALNVTEGISTDGDISDGQGDLSNFTTTDGATRA